MRKLFLFLFAALMSAGMFAATVTWNSSTLSSIYLHGGDSFTKDGVTLTVLDGMIDGRNFMGFSNDASFKFSTSLGNFTKIEITGNINVLGGSGWTQTILGAVWTGEANETTFGMSFDNVSQIVFTIGEPTVAVTGVTLNQNEAQMTVGGETLTLTATVNPNNATDQSVSWSTSDANVATVDNGVVTAVAAGNATITVTTTDGSFTATCAVTVSNPAPAEVTVVFAANNKTVERTVTLPHTFKCSWDNGMDGPDELDIIIHELYNDYYYCNSNMNASGSDQVEVGTEEAPKNDYITIKGVFEGTVTVTGDYFDWITGEEGAHNYSITISIKGDEPQPQPDPTVMFIAFPTENRPENIELAGVNREYTWEMVALDNDPWYVSKEHLNTYATDTIKFRDAANNAMSLCEYIPANGGQEGRWQQLYLVMGDYPMDSYKLDIVRLIEELDLSNATNFAWMENAPEPLPEGIEHIVLTEKAKKVIMDGMIYIVRDGKLFNLTGAQVR